MKKVTIVGVGALGSHLIQFIRNENISIKIIDYDKVEKKNTLSQFHTVKTVGKSKVQSIQQTFKFMFNLSIDGVPHKLTKDNVDTLLANSDLVIDCLDNAEARTLIQTYVRKNKVPCLHGAVSANGDFGQVMWDELFKIDSEGSPGQATCEDGIHLAFLGQVSSCLAQSVHQYLINNKKINYFITPLGVNRV